MGERPPDGGQRLLHAACWDAAAVRDDVQAYGMEHLGDPSGVLVMDETGVRKTGSTSVGVARQDSGTAGRRETCPRGVFLASASPRGHTLLDRSRSRPQEWSADRVRRHAAGVPDGLALATTGALATARLQRAFDTGVPTAWVAGDEGGGTDGARRPWLPAPQRPHVLAVARSHMVGRGWVQVRVDAVLAEVPADAWGRIEVAQGRKGRRVYAWARARRPDATAAGAAQWLLVRRSVSEPAAVASERAFGPAEVSLAEVARVASTRGIIEARVERAQGAVGLDQSEGRRWDAWHRHITLCRLAHAYREVTRAQAHGSSAAALAADHKGVPAP
jgi:SRSO17 transposase